jgi:hypothetical protein
VGLRRFGSESAVELAAVRFALLCVLAVLVVAPPVGAAGGRTYSGNGTLILAPVSFPHGATARFTTDGNGLFMLIAMKTTNASVVNPQMVVSQARRGSSFIPPGRYTFKVSSFGGWRLTLTPA